MRALQVLCLVLSVYCSAALADAPTQRPALRVCADPNNLPFSNDRGEGIETNLAELIAKHMNRELSDAVARGEIDVAIAWGPLAGFFAKRSAVPLEIALINPDHPSAFPMTFDIAMAVRHGESAFKAEIESVLDEKQLAIEDVLQQFGVPLLPLGSAAPDASASGGAP